MRSGHSSRRGRYWASTQPRENRVVGRVRRSVTARLIHRVCEVTIRAVVRTSARTGAPSGR